MNTTKAIDVSTLTPEEKENLFKELQSEKSKADQQRREAYQSLRADFIASIASRVSLMAGDVRNLYDYVVKECNAFYSIMKEHGQLRHDGQLNYKIEHNNFRIEVKTNKVKGFDERATIAAARLIDFLEKWIANTGKETDDPMYQLAMTLLERNQAGDFDYKSISKLYQLEDKFNNTEYGEIMQLFKDSNTVEGTATNYYFHQKDERGVWRRLEISFNRL